MSKEGISKRNIGILLSFSVLFLLAVLPIISNSRPSNLSALSYTFYLSLWQLVCSIPFFFYESTKLKKGIFQKSIDSKMRSKILKIMGITGIIFSISTFLYVFAIETAGTVSGSIVMETYPLFSIFMEFFIFRKKRRNIEIFFTLIIIVGIYYLGTEGTWLFSDFSIWFGVALIVPFLWSIAHVIIKNTIDTSPITPSQITFIRVLISSVVLFGISSSVNGIDNVLEGLMNPEFQIFGFLMGLVFYLELINWFYAVKYVEVSVASTITTPAPLVTMIFVFLILKESIRFYHIIAMIIVITSLYGLLWARNKKNKVIENVLIS